MSMKMNRDVKSPSCALNLCGNPEEIRHELDLHLNLTSAYSRNLTLPNHVVG
jgi:hypothetical protein